MKLFLMLILSISTCQAEGAELYRQSFDDPSNYSRYNKLTQGARAEHSTGLRGGAVKYFLHTTPYSSLYAGFQYFDLPTALYQSDTIHIRWCMQFGPTFLKNLDGSKLLIVHRGGVREPPNPRIMVFFHQYRTGKFQMYSGNNIDRDPPNPPLITLNDKMDRGQWICPELGLSLSRNSRKLWITQETGKEKLIQEETLNRQDGFWTGGVEFGFFGPPAGVDDGNWYKLDELVISRSKIGPPPGFGAAPPIMASPQE